MKRLFRSPHNRVIGGVCGGIGEYLEVDPVLIRLIWGVFFFLGGIGFLAYIVAWIIIPLEKGIPDSTNIQEDHKNRANYSAQIIIGLLLVIVGSALLVRDWWYVDHIFRNFVLIGGKYLLPIVFIALGLYVIVRSDRKRSEK
jgi:phage shock protein C